MDWFSLSGTNLDLPPDMGEHSFAHDRYFEQMFDAGKWKEGTRKENLFEMAQTLISGERHVLFVGCTRLQLAMVDHFQSEEREGGIQVAWNPRIGNILEELEPSGEETLSPIGGKTLVIVNTDMTRLESKDLHLIDMIARLGTVRRLKDNCQEMRLEHVRVVGFTKTS